MTKISNINSWLKIVNFFVMSRKMSTFAPIKTKKGIELWNSRLRAWMMWQGFLFT